MSDDRESYVIKYGSLYKKTFATVFIKSKPKWVLVKMNADFQGNQAVITNPGLVYISIKRVLCQSTAILLINSKPLNLLWRILSNGWDLYWSTRNFLKFQLPMLIVAGQTYRMFEYLDTYIIQTRWFEHPLFGKDIWKI